MKRCCKLFAAYTLFLINCLGAASLASAACSTDKTITIAEMTWLSASGMAHITHRILSDGYGCNAQLVPGDTVPTGASMLTKGKPHIAPEFWVSTAEATWQKMENNGNVYKAGRVFSDGGKEGWWIPDYVAEENPGLKSITDLPRYAELFTEIGNLRQGRLYGCPPGWGCEIVTNNLFKALNLQESYELFSPGSGANLKASIVRKVTRREPFVAYYWGPTAVIGKYNLVRLDMPPYDAQRFSCLTNVNCANPQVSGWKPGEVVVAAVTALRTDAPEVALFLSKLQISNATINRLLAWADDRSADGAEMAQYFLQTERAVWQKWVPADIAQNLEATL